LLFGTGDTLRNLANVSGGIDESSDAYSYGSYTSIAAGGAGTFRAIYAAGFKLASLSSNMAFLQSVSAVRNLEKRLLGPALFSAAERAKIVPFTTHVARKGFDAARVGLGRTRATYNKLIALSLGDGGWLNDYGNND
jgi:hypothetical protein